MVLRVAPTALLEHRGNISTCKTPGPPRSMLTCSMISSAKRCAPPAAEPYQRSATPAAVMLVSELLAVQISSTRAIMAP
eukprot:COSAG02_NODE_832_length_16660_cov_16.228006_17_plen_79_part_00